MVLGTVAGEIGFTGMFGWIAAIMGAFLLLAVIQYRSRDTNEVSFEEIEDAE